jgi:heme exporter protein A
MTSIRHLFTRSKEGIQEPKPVYQRPLGPDGLDPTSLPLTAEDLACRRGERLVFAGVSFCLRRGGALVLSGANGSGKTSLLRLLATLAAPAAGRLVWGTAPIAADIAAYRERLGYIGHQDGVKPGLTPRETLMFWAALRGLGPSRAPLPVNAALETFGLEGVADWPCQWLSAGQRRRLALARLIAAPALIWLLDEPTSALDHDNQLRLEHAIAGHRALGGRVVLASHTPIDVDAAGVISLDNFAPLPGHAAAV